MNSEQTNPVLRELDHFDATIAELEREVAKFKTLCNLDGLPPPINHPEAGASQVDPPRRHWWQALAFWRRRLL